MEFKLNDVLRYKNKRLYRVCLLKVTKNEETFLAKNVYGEREKFTKRHYKDLKPATYSEYKAELVAKYDLPHELLYEITPENIRRRTNIFENLWEKNHPNELKIDKKVTKVQHAFLSCLINFVRLDFISFDSMRHYCGIVESSVVPYLKDYEIENVFDLEKHVFYLLNLEL